MNQTHTHIAAVAQGMGMDSPKRVGMERSRTCSAQPAPLFQRGVPKILILYEELDMSQTLQAIDSKVEQCINKQVAVVSAKILETCYSKDSLNDYLVLKYNQNQYHTTLYYYDQAGNLTKTVPPREG